MGFELHKLNESLIKTARTTARQKQFEDLWKSLVGLNLADDFNFKIYSNHWTREGHSSTCALPAQLKPWLKLLNSKACKCLSWLYWAAPESFICKTINSPMNSDTIIHKKYVHEWIHVAHFTTILNTMNSEYWIILDFSNEFNLWIHVHEI